MVKLNPDGAVITQEDESPIHILWINCGLSCDGESVSLTAATQPSIEEIALRALPGMPKVALHWPFIDFECGPEQGGDNFIEWFHKADRGELGPFVLVIEGSIPNETINGEGFFTGFGRHPSSNQPITVNGSVASVKSKIRQAWSMRRRSRRVPALRSGFAGFRFPPEVITLAVRWYLRYGLSYRDVEELLAERGITVDHVSVYRWVQRFTPLLIDAARPCRHIPGDRWFVDETYVKVSGRWVYLYRAIDQFGQVIDVLVSERRDLAATHRFFTQALAHGRSPTEVTTDRAPAYPRVLDELLPAACHVTEQYANNAIEADHGRLKSRLRPMRGLKRLRSARVISAGHAFVQNLHRGHYELATDIDPRHRIPQAFTELVLAI
jgi:IS6 family transposase